MAHVLIVDDDDILRATIADILVEAGYDVSEASNGAEALERLQHGLVVDVILSDVRMPTMDGLTFLREVKNLDETISVVMLTGHGSIDAAVNAMRKGAINYLLKPADKDLLLDSVHEAVDMRRQNLSKQAVMSQVVAGLQKLGIVDHAPAETLSPAGLQIADLMIDEERLEARYRGEPLNLTPSEFGILHQLMQARGRVVTFEEIAYRLQGIWTDRDEARSMISTHISNLRNKLRDAGCEHYLVNSRGHGYLLETPDE